MGTGGASDGKRGQGPKRCKSHCLLAARAGCDGAGGESDPFLALTLARIFALCSCVCPSEDVSELRLHWLVFRGLAKTPDSPSVQAQSNGEELQGSHQP